MFVAGCATLEVNPDSLLIKEVDASLTDLRAAASNSLPVGQRSISQNGRELLSKMFIIDKDRYKPAADSSLRYYAQFKILGDRRPYDIEILVFTEKRVLRGNQFVYAMVGHDRTLAKELEQKFRLELTKRREDRNIIDDFRVF
jgi:hypothetical protein